MPIDVNANTTARTRRNWQQIATGAITAYVTLALAGGVENSSGLKIKLDGASLSLSASGLRANLDAAGAIENNGTNGLRVKLNGATLDRSSSGLKVANGAIGSLQLGILTTKGDLLGFGTSHARLPASGTNGQVLTVDSTATLGFGWATPATPGEVNTASNAGASGVGVFESKVGVDLQFRNIAAAAGSLITVASGGANKTIVLDIGTVTVAKGGTGGTNAATAFNALSPLTTKGDVLTYNGTNNVRVPVGTDEQIVVADSTQTLGLKFANRPRLFATITTTSNIVVSSTSEVDFNQQVTIPANTLAVGSVLRFRFQGTFGATGTPTLRLRVYLGLILYDFGLVTVGAPAVPNWYLEGEAVITAIGASGSQRGHCTEQIDTNKFTPGQSTGATIDTTASNILKVSAQWSASSASNTITMFSGFVELLK